MAEFKTKVRKAQYALKHRLLTFDNLLVAGAALFCLIWTGGSIAAMSRNWELAQEVTARQREKALLELEVETMELENTYYTSTEYQELAARKYQGKMLPGETMIYLPENSETARNKHKTDANAAEEEEPEMTNLEQWLRFLLGKSAVVGAVGFEPTTKRL